MSNQTPHIVQTQAAQGDLLIRRIDALPPGLHLQAATEGRHVLAHSETGHHHVVQAEGCRYYLPRVDVDAQGDADTAGPPMLAYLEVLDTVDVQHLRGHDTHEPLRLPAGIYELRRHREYWPTGWRAAAD